MIKGYETDTHISWWKGKLVKKSYGNQFGDMF